MTLQPSFSIALVAAMAVLATGATAATVSSVSIVDTTEFGSNTLSDSAVDGDVSVAIPFNGSFAEQNADGTSDVEAGVAGFGPKSKVTATAQFDQEETNTFGMERDYTLSYELTGQEADFNFGGAEVFTVRNATPSPTAARVAPSNPDNPFTADDDPTALPAGFDQFSAASFEYIIEVNGNEVFNARADALLNAASPFGGLVFDAVSGFTPTQTSNGGGYTFAVGPISGDIELGTFAAGETISVTSTLIARAYTPGGGFDGFPIGVNTFSSDPISLSSIGSLSSVPTTPPNPAAVPLPAAGWMLIAALGGMGIAARRKKA